MNCNIQYSAAVTIDGEVRSVSGNETVEVNQMVTGSQTIGNSYEILQGIVMPTVGMVLYNKGTVDVSVRITNQPSTNYADVDWTVSDLNDPAITVITPNSVAAYTYDQDFTLTCTDGADNDVSFVVRDVYRFRVGVTRSGSTDTFTVDMNHRIGTMS
jgi:hypothetical protein